MTIHKLPSFIDIPVYDIIVNFADGGQYLVQL
jgi:hypothetical protein